VVTGKFFQNKDRRGYKPLYSGISRTGRNLIGRIDFIQIGPNGTLIEAAKGVFGLRKEMLARMLDDCLGLPEKIWKKEFKYVFELVAYNNECKANL